MTSKVMQTSSALAAVSSTQRPRTARLLGKPAPLSKAQKQANHIQSEQRRRANIRRGYAALCEAVPALREAIQEEALATDSPAAKSKTGRARGGRGVEKVDGRSGPRSENVVLFNSTHPVPLFPRSFSQLICLCAAIDYLNDLLVERQGLRARLERARAVLPPGHPARTPAESEPLWELEWKGGAGFNGDAEGEEDDSP
jgi:hypothetical protein